MVSDIIREPALQWASWGDHDQILYWVLLADCLSSFKLSIKSFFADCYCFSNCLWSPFSRFVASDMRTCITVSLLRWSCLKGINCQPKFTRLFHRALLSTKSFLNVWRQKQIPQMVTTASWKSGWTVTENIDNIESLNPNHKVIDQVRTRLLWWRWK